MIDVLIVEDHWVWASAVAKHLDETDGIEVVGIASTADEGIALGAKLQPNVALVDLLLGEDSGIRVARMLGTRSPTTRVAIITTEPTPWAAEEAWGAGVVALVAKDELLTHQELVSLVVDTATRQPGDPGSQGLGATIESLPYGLTSQELEIICCLSGGMGTPEIASRLCVGRQTVRNKTSDIGRKLGVSGRLEIVARAIADRLIDPRRPAG